MNRFALTFTTFILFTVCLNAQRAGRAAAIDTSRFALVEGGTFAMGTGVAVEPHEAPVHTVTVPSFYMSRTEVTFDEFDTFCKAVGRDTIPITWERSGTPAFMVSWLDAVEYCNWLSAKEGLSKCYTINGLDVKWNDTCRGYRLPTEAEWEFAARGGNRGSGSLYAGDSVLARVGWFRDNSAQRPQPVRTKAPNELGLFDMNGNLWEWVWDWYDGGYYAVSPMQNPEGPATGNYKVMRGGAWYNYSNYATVYTRQNHHVGYKQNSLGFRIARTYFQPRKK